MYNKSNKTFLSFENIILVLCIIFFTCAMYQPGIISLSKVRDDQFLINVNKLEVSKDIANNRRKPPQNLNHNSLPLKNIIIGDSQTPFVDWGSESFNLISKTSGQSSLWQGGITLDWLLKAVKKYPVDSTVTNLAIVIGTNGLFNKNDNIIELITECKFKFPNAKLYVVQGSWGWGGVSNKTESQVKDYYKKFSELGVQVVEPPIGKIEPHGKKPIYKIIGKSLDSLVKA